MTRSRRPYSCAWCGREAVDSETGRHRKYCRRSCRQRAYEQRALTAGTKIADDAVILSRREFDSLLDRLFSLRCAVEDLATAIAETSPHTELDTLCAHALELAHDSERIRGC